MILTVLGSGTVHPDPQRGGPSYLVTHQDAHLMLDAGPVATRGLRRAGLSQPDLDGVCITHRHPVHPCELGLILELGKTLGRTRPLVVAGPAVLDELIAFLMNWARPAPSRGAIFSIWARASFSPCSVVSALVRYPAMAPGSLASASSWALDRAMR